VEVDESEEDYEPKRGKRSRTTKGAKSAGKRPRPSYKSSAIIEDNLPSLADFEQVGKLDKKTETASEGCGGPVTSDRSMATSAASEGRNGQASPDIHTNNNSLLLENSDNNVWEDELPNSPEAISDRSMVTPTASEGRNGQAPPDIHTNNNSLL
jgi:hypothetical protein